MKKLFLTLACVWMALASFAQMNVWHNGELIFQRDYTLIDSITFGEVPVIDALITPFSLTVIVSIELALSF